MVVMAPSNEDETRKLLSTGYLHQGPAAVRYPRGTGPGESINPELEGVEIGKAKLVQHGQSVALLAFGSLFTAASNIAKSRGYSLIDMRFVKPLDEAIIRQMAANHDLLVTLEENCIAGGAGSAVLEFLSEEGISTPCLLIGLPDQFVEHAKPNELLSALGLNQSAIEEKIDRRLHFMAPGKGKTGTLD